MKSKESPKTTVEAVNALHETIRKNHRENSLQAAKAQRESRYSILVSSVVSSIALTLSLITLVISTLGGTDAFPLIFILLVCFVVISVQLLLLYSVYLIYKR